MALEIENLDLACRQPAVLPACVCSRGSGIVGLTLKRQARTSVAVCLLRGAAYASCVRVVSERLRHLKPLQLALFSRAARSRTRTVSDLKC
eukprot:scaffold23924_cov74-Phaeocystis_antarctica.AAC.1